MGGSSLEKAKTLDRYMLSRGDFFMCNEGFELFGGAVRLGNGCRGRPKFEGVE
jgi:hypothetical protein